MLYCKKPPYRRITQFALQAWWNSPTRKGGGVARVLSWHSDQMVCWDNNIIASKEAKQSLSSQWQTSQPLQTKILVIIFYLNWQYGEEGPLKQFTKIIQSNTFRLNNSNTSHKGKLWYQTQQGGLCHSVGTDNWGQVLEFNIAVNTGPVYILKLSTAWHFINRYLVVVLW